MNNRSLSRKTLLPKRVSGRKVPFTSDSSLFSLSLSLFFFFFFLSRRLLSLSLCLSLSSRSFFLLFSFVYFFPATFSCRLCTLHFPFTLRKPLLLLSSSSSSLSLSLSLSLSPLRRSSLSYCVMSTLLSPEGRSVSFFFFSFDSS